MQLQAQGSRITTLIFTFLSFLAIGHPSHPRLMTNFLDSCNIELSNHSLNNVYAVYVKSKKGCTLKFVTTQIVCGGCLGTPNTRQKSSAFIQPVLTLKNLSPVFSNIKKRCDWKKLRKRIKNWRSTNLKNGALCKTLKESPYSASPSRAELNSKQNTPNTCDKTMAKRYMTNITETKEQWNKNIFSRRGIFLCKKVLGLNAKNRQFLSSSASTVRSVRKVLLHISFLSTWLRKVVQSPVNKSSQVSGHDLRSAFFNDDRTLIHLLWHKLYTHCQAHTGRAYGNRPFSIRFCSVIPALTRVPINLPALFAPLSSAEKRKKTEENCR